MECYCGHYYCKNCRIDWLQTTQEPSVNEKCKSCPNDVNPYGMEKLKTDDKLNYNITYICTNDACRVRWTEDNLEEPNTMGSCTTCGTKNIQPYMQQVQVIKKQ